MNFLPLWRYQNQLIDGAIVTLELTVIAALAGLLIGVAGAVALNGRITPLRWLVRGYIELFRNTPSLIQIFHRLLRAAELRPEAAGVRSRRRRAVALFR